MPPEAEQPDPSLSDSDRSKPADGPDRPRVILSPGRLKAEIVIPKDCNDSDIQPEKLLELLYNQGIHVTDRVKAEVLKLAEHVAEGYRDLRITVVQGRAPVHGEDGWMQWVEGCHPDVLHMPEPDPTGRIDYYQTSPFTMVQTGQAIATIFPPKPGQPGVDIYGQPITPKPGAPVRLDKDESLILQADGQLVAGRDGILSNRDGRLSVEPIMIIDRFVDFSTGNITFPGTVEIGKGVRDKFTVDSGGDVLAYGLVEASNIRCKGNLRLEGGMAGKDVGSIIVGGDAFARYLTAVKGQVKGNLWVDYELMQCRMHIGDELKTRRVIGGRITACGPARIRMLGSKAGVDTELILGKVPDVSAMLNDITEMLPDLYDFIKIHRRQFPEIDTMIQNNDYTHRNPRISELAKKVKRMIDSREHLLDERAKLIEQFRKKVRIDLIVETHIHPGVDLFLPFRKLAFIMPLKGPVHLQCEVQPAVIDGKRVPPEEICQYKLLDSSKRRLAMDSVARMSYTSQW